MNPLVLNFSHPLSAPAIAALKDFYGDDTEIRRIDVHVDLAKSLYPQMAAIADNAKLSYEEWSTRPIACNMPGLATAATMLLAILHGRMGHFPEVIQLKKSAGIYVIADLECLQDIRNKERKKRFE